MNASDDIQVVDPVLFLKQVDPENRLAAYFDLLRTENRRINLVSRETLGSDSGNNFPLQALAAESLFPLIRPELGKISSYMDIGSGGGFPALPFIILKQPQEAVLVERTRKKADALRRMLIGLDCRASVEASPFERLSFGHPFDLITLRLVKLTPDLLKAILRYLKSDAYLVYYSRPEFDLTGFTVSSTTYYYATGSDTTPKSCTLLKKV